RSPRREDKGSVVGPGPGPGTSSNALRSPRGSPARGEGTPPRKTAGLALLHLGPPWRRSAALPHLAWGRRTFRAHAPIWRVCRSDAGDVHRGQYTLRTILLGGPCPSVRMASRQQGGRLL